MTRGSDEADGTGTVGVEGEGAVANAVAGCSQCIKFTRPPPLPGKTRVSHHHNSPLLLVFPAVWICDLN